jgi:uncharacterized protein (TIGR02145 family)
MRKHRLPMIVLFLAGILILSACKEDPIPIPKPDVKFVADMTIAWDETTISFTNRTLNEPSSWLWSFGDGNTSTDQEPAHVYNSAGTYTVELTAENESGTSSLEKPDYITIIETGTLTDDRDGNSYRSVEIGNQVWMAENLKYLPSVAQVPDEQSYTDPLHYVHTYYGTDVNAAKATEEYLTYGVLYNWPALMNGEQSSNNIPSGVQGVCPAGWHVPSQAEWNELIVHLGGTDIAGGKLKETGGLHWNSNVGATNETGFTALPGGALLAYAEDGIIELPTFTMLELGTYWTTTERNEKIASAYILNSGDAGLYHLDNWNSKGNGFSVRCIQD